MGETAKEAADRLGLECNHGRAVSECSKCLPDFEDAVNALRDIAKQRDRFNVLRLSGSPTQEHWDQAKAWLRNEAGLLCNHTSNGVPTIAKHECSACVDAVARLIAGIERRVTP